MNVIAQSEQNRAQPDGCPVAALQTLQSPPGCVARFMAAEAMMPSRVEAAGTGGGGLGDGGGGNGEYAVWPGAKGGKGGGAQGVL